MHDYSRTARAGAWALAALLASFPLLTAQAQTASLSPAPMAGEEMLGEQYCFDASWENAGAPGYGPYLRIVLPPELQFDSASLFGSGLNVVGNAVFPASGILPDPFFLPATAPDNEVAGNAGDRLIVLSMPVGSVVANGPDMITTICVTSNNAPPDLANVGQPYPIQITPVYRFGDAATGNASIVSPPVSPTLTPQVLRLTKTNTAPENERPPGAIWPYDYVLTVDIANGALVTPIVIADSLPADVQFVGPISISGGAGCVATQTPSTSTPGGNVEVTCSGNNLGTSSDADIVVNFPVHVTDILDGGFCTTASLDNTASADGTYKPAGGGADVVLPQATDGSHVTARHVAIQKGASQGNGVPDDIVTYTLDLQVNEYDGAVSSLSILDTLPDGMDLYFAGPGSMLPQISFNGGAATAIAPANYTANIGAVNDTLEINVRNQFGANIPAGTAIRIQYTAQVLQDYETAPFAPVLAADPLTNNVTATYDMVAGAPGCSDTSAATVTINPVSIEKKLIDPSTPGAEVVPGDVVTFRLTMSIPSGDTQGVQFIDYFPLPVFDATTIAPGDVTLSVEDTFGVAPNSVTSDAATNSLTIGFPDVSTLNPVVVSVDVKVTVQPNAFADDLYLTNIFHARSENSDGNVDTGETPVQIHVRAPELTLVKGVAATNGEGTISPVTTPPSGNLANADAGDQVDFVITIRNTGGAPAYDVVVTDTVPAGLTGCSVTGAELSDGTPLSSSGDLFTTGLTLINGAANAPVLDAAGGSNPDTAQVDVRCTVAAGVLPGSTITNTASATWKPQPAGTPGVETFPPVQDDADVGIRQVALNKSIAATSEAASTSPNVMIGEVVRYRLQITVPEGGIPNAIVRDNLPSGMQYLGNARVALVSNGGLTASGAAGAGVGNSVPAAPMTSQGVPITATPGQGGAGTFNCAGASFGEGTDPCFALGNVSNSDSDADAEYIIIEFNALVLNVTGNNGTTNRNNNFRIGSNGAQLGPVSNNATVTPRLPSVSVGKAVSPNSGVQAGDTVTYTLTIANASGTNVMPAYDVSVNDALPVELSLITASVSATASGGAGPFAFSGSGNAVSGTINVIPAGGSVTITYDATVLVAVAPGSQLINAVSGGWSSLPGSNGSPGNDTGSNAPGAPGDGNGERTFTGTAQAPIAVTPVTLGKAVVATSLPYTGDGEVRPGIADLAIGETATFHITATIPEGTTAGNVVITDTVPYTNGRMEVLSGSVVSTGSGMTIATPNPTPVIADAQLGDGINDTISFDFGQIINPVGNNTPTPQTIVVAVLARLVDHVDNTNGDQLTNNATVQFGPGLSGTAQAGVDVVEPLLDIQKSGNASTGQAGDTVNFTVTVTHEADSSAEARALRIVDTLPTPHGLSNLVFGSALVDSGCTAAPAPSVSNNSTAAALDVTVDFLPVGCSVTITYSATLEADVIINTDVINTANLSWHSITPGDPAGPGRDYSDSDTHTVRVSSPGMMKWVAAVAPDIGDDQVDNTLPDVTIGGVVTWQFEVVLPAGDSLAAVVTDQLPVNTVSMAVVSSRIVSVGAGISGISPSPTPVVGTAGTATDGSDPDSYNDLVTWNLGDLRGSPSGDRSMVFEVVARVMDTAQTTGGVSVTNTAGFDASTLVDPIEATAEVDIVEPKLQLAKAIAQINGAAPDPARIVQAGDVVSFQVTVSHQGSSTADAFNVVVTDALPNPGLGPVSNVGGTCGVTAGTGYPVVSFAVGVLPLGNSCTITYDAVVTNSVNPGRSYANDAVAGYTSLADPSDPGVRTGETNHDHDTITVHAPSLVKVVTDTSLGDTGNGQHTGLEDLAIGETVTYTLTIGFPQGTTNNAVLVDTLPAGLEAVGASVLGLGNTGITTSLPGTPALSDSGIGYNDTVTFDFGTITNPANASLTDDWIQVSVTARVKDLPANVDGEVLTNTATFSNDTSPDVEDEADIELVEPVLGLTKTMVQGSAAGSAVITLSIENTGTGPAYDIVLEDVLSHAVWLDTSIAAGTTPTGFTASLDTATPGQTTVLFSSNAGVGLLPGASVTATINASLAVFPPSPNPVLNSAEIPGYGSVPEDPTNPDIRIHDPEEDDATLGFPAPVVTKTVANAGSGSGGAFVPGDVVVFNVNVQNTGPVALNDVTLTDVVPAHTTFNAAQSHAGWTGCADGAATGSTCTLGTFTVAAGATETRAFAVRIVNPLPAGVEHVANQAVLSSPDVPGDVPSDDPDTSDPDDPTEVPVQAAPDLVLTKADNVASGDFAAPGDTIIYTLSYQNVGSQDATGVVITETVPANTFYNGGASTAGWTCAPNGQAGATCSFPVGNVAAGAASASVAFAVTIVDPIPAGTTSIGNTASVADDGTNGPDPTPGNNSDDETTPLEGTPGLHLTKSDGGVTAEPGDVVVYTLRYWNDGDTDVANGVITEMVPANTSFVPGSSTAGWVCSPDNSAGSTCSLNVGTLVGQTDATGAGTALFAVQIDNPLAAGVEQVDNVASLGGTGVTPVDAGDDTPVNAVPDMAISKTAGAGSVAAGDVLVYTLSYRNLGNQNATGVVITEVVPAHTSFNLGASTPGWSCADAAPAGSICSFAVPGTVVAGQPAVDVLFAVNIPDPVPAGVETIGNAVSIADDGSNGPDPNPDNNDDQVTTPVDAMPQLRVSKTDGGVTVAPGDAINYVISYENIGDQDASGVFLTEVVPQHTTYTGSGWSCAPSADAGSVCTYAVPGGTVVAGAPAATVNFQVTVDNPLAAGVDGIANHVIIQSDGAGGEPSDPPTDPSDPRQDDEDTPVEAVPDLSILKSSTSTARAGEVVVYDLAYANLGNQEATGVVISETVPANTTFDQAGSSAGWSCADGDPAGTACSLSVGAVPGGQSLPPGTVVQFAVRVDDPLAAGFDEISNSVRIDDDGTNGDDPDPDNNEDDEVLPVEATPDLVIVKRANAPIATPGSVIGFTLTYSNVGDQDATGVVITETVPVGTEFNAAGSDSGWSCADGDPAGTTCTWTVGNLAADGVEHEVIFAVRITGNGEIRNHVTIEDDGSNGPDPTPEDNESDARVSSKPIWVPVDAPWALLLMMLAMGGLAWRRRWMA